MAVRYRRVAQSEPEEEGENLNKKERAERIERITAKLHALVWLLVSGFLIYYTDLFELLLESNDIDRWALNLSVLSFAVVVGIFCYLAVWLPFVMKNTIPWEIYCPTMVPIATGASVLSFLSFVYAMWPVWGLLAPLFSGILVIGGIFLSHFVPWPC